MFFSRCNARVYLLVSHKTFIFSFFINKYYITSSYNNNNNNNNTHKTRMSWAYSQSQGVVLAPLQFARTAGAYGWSKDQFALPTLSTRTVSSVSVPRTRRREKNEKRLRFRLRPSHSSPPPLLASVSRCSGVPVPPPRRRCTPTHSVAAIRCVSSSWPPLPRGSSSWSTGMTASSRTPSRRRSPIPRPGSSSPTPTLMWVVRDLPPRSGSGGLEGLEGPDHSRYSCRRKSRCEWKWSNRPRSLVSSNATRDWSQWWHSMVSWCRCWCGGSGRTSSPWCFCEWCQNYMFGSAVFNILMSNPENAVLIMQFYILFTPR